MGRDKQAWGCPQGLDMLIFVMTVNCVWHDHIFISRLFTCPSVKYESIISLLAANYNNDVNRLISNGEIVTIYICFKIH